MADKHKSQVKKLLHGLYNDLAQENDPRTREMREAVIEVYGKADLKDSVALANHLVNYMYFTGYTQKIKLTKTQQVYIRQLADIGKYAGMNGAYRQNYGDANQF